MAYVATERLNVSAHLSFPVLKILIQTSLMKVRLVFFSKYFKFKYMETSKKQIKKELRKTIKLISKLKNGKVKNNQGSLLKLYNEVNGIKNVVKFILEQKKEKEVQKDLETV